jgi:hypothetical protein
VGVVIARLGRRLGLRRRLVQVTRFGDSANPFVPFNWEPDNRGGSR